MARLDATSPIEVWLTQKNMQVTCMVAVEDETTTSIDVDSLSMRGAQREITGYLLANGYEPVGRWSTEFNSGLGSAGETMRRFRPARKH